jgi:hypothetical protein
MDASQTLDGLKRFCERHGIRTDRVLAMTIQRNYTGEHATVFASWAEGSLLTHYPAGACPAALACVRGQSCRRGF